MATQKLDQALAREAWEAWQRHGGPTTMGARRDAAAELGLSVNTFASRVLRYRDPAIEDAMHIVGTGMTPSLAWIKTKATDDSPAVSVLLKPPELPDDTLERIREAFEGMKPAERILPPKSVMSDLCTLYPLMDMHIGMHAWGEETGGPDYDLKLAALDMRNAMAKIRAITPQSDTAILILGGDTFHANDDTAETPRTKNKLDVDGRQFKVLDVAISIIAEQVEALASMHRNVIVRVMRGNHDPASHMVLTFAIAERYRDNPRIEVEKNPQDLFMRQWGKCAIFAHHGDKGKPEQMALYLSDVCRFWSETRHRHYFTGHVHKDQARDVGPLRWESLRAFCPPDAWAAGMGYSARRALQSVTFHKEDGIVLRALDPISR